MDIMQMVTLQIEGWQLISAIGVIVSTTISLWAINKSNKKEIKKRIDKKAGTDYVDEKLQNMEVTMNLKIDGIKSDINRHENTFHTIDKKLDDMPKKIVDLIAPLLKNR